MSTAQVWELKGVMAGVASYCAIRCRRRTEVIGAATSVLETVLLLVGVFIAGGLVIAAWIRLLG